MESALSHRSFADACHASTWEEIWEAGPYYQRVSEMLEDAKSYAVLTGWQIDSRLPLPRPERPGHPPDPTASGLETLKDKILRLCESKPDFHFYILMWDHAYFYCLERESWQGRIWEDIHPRVHFLFDNRHPFGGSHHEKLCIVDGRVGFCGGIDLCDERWDSPQHLFWDPRRSLSWRSEKHGPYHDLAVQVAGPICLRLLEHIRDRWEAISSIPFPSVENSPADHVMGGHTVYLSRTLASVDAGDKGPSIIREIEFLFRELIGEAKKRVVLEGQYYWSREINDLLISRMRALEGTGFEIYLILADLTKTKSLTRKMAIYEMSLLEELAEAAEQTGTKLVMGAPYIYAPPTGSPTPPPKSVYVHSKVLIIDDRYLSIGSANLAARALRVDTEINLTLEAQNEAERAHIARVAAFVLDHWAIQGSSSAHHQDVRLHAFKPRIFLNHYRRKSRWAANRLTWIRWEIFFDPELPWLYPFKRRYRLLARTQYPIAIFGTVLIWFLGAACVLLLSGPVPHERAGSVAAYSFVLSASWLLPIPVTLTSLLAAIQLGWREAIQVLAPGIWVSALWGYSLARMFPTTAARFYRQTAPSWLPQRLGLRNFPTLISVVADPRVSFRSKIAYQGLYCVPFPWFALTTLLLLPAAIYLIARAADAMSPARWTAWVAPNGIWVVLAIGVLGSGKMALRLWKNES